VKTLYKEADLLLEDLESDEGKIIGVEIIGGEAVKDEESEPEEDIDEEKDEEEIEPEEAADSDLVRAYFHSMGDIPVLSREDEVELFKKYEERTKELKKIILPLPIYVKILNQLKKENGGKEPEEKNKAMAMCVEELNSLTKKAKNKKRENLRHIKSVTGLKIDDLKSLRRKANSLIGGIGIIKDEIIIRNLRLVVNTAKNYVGRGLPLLDLIQEGNMGLIKAVDKFKYRKGFKFSTYAVWWIRQAITRALVDQTKTIRVPVHMIELYNRVSGASKELTQQLGRKPSNWEIAEKLKIPLKKVEKVLVVVQDTIDLGMPVGEDDSVLSDFIKDADSILPDLETEEKSVSNEILAVLRTLTLREEIVVKMRYGIGHERDYTLEEVGKQLSVTRERVRQIEAKALRKLKHPQRSNKLKFIIEGVEGKYDSMLNT